MGDRMMERLFNNEIELATRFMIILCETNSLTTSKLIGYDFICTYGADFDISLINLHGNSEVRYSEISAKRNIAQKAIKLLIGYRYLNVTNTHDGFTYSITRKGNDFCQKLNDDYCQKYRALALKAIEKYSNYADNSLINEIHNQAKKKLGGEGIE